MNFKKGGQTTTRRVIRGCSRRDIPNAAQLANRNLLITRVRCSDRILGLRRGECFPIESNLLYRCAQGFRFVNGDRRFTATCLRNFRWEQAPRCVHVPGFRTTTIPIRPHVPPTVRRRRGCARSALPNADAQNRLNIRELRVRCHEILGIRRGECNPIDSSAQYRCRRGFRFAGRSFVRFNSQCQRNNQWEAIPRCIRIPRKKNF